MFGKILLAVLNASLALVICERSICKLFSSLKQCQFSLAKNRLHSTIKVAHPGIGQSECLNKMERFYWSTGIYCPLSSFCAWEIDLSRSHKVSDEISPVKELCNIWVRNSVTNCNDVLTSFYQEKILKGKSCVLWSCYSYYN